MQAERAVIQMDLDGNTIEEFPSMKKAAKKFGGTNKTYAKIVYACEVESRRSTRKVVLSSNEALGYKWKFKD